jgi:hypothetical protein
MVEMMRRIAHLTEYMIWSFLPDAPPAAFRSPLRRAAIAVLRGAAGRLLNTLRKRIP